MTIHIQHEAISNEVHIKSHCQGGQEIWQTEQTAEHYYFETDGCQRSRNTENGNLINT
jgi:hypothetical protein